MRLAIMGATGRTGVPLVQHALERGYEVTALARSPQKAEQLLGDPPGLTVVEGDLLDPAAVEKAIVGSAAVLNVAGQVKGSPKDLQQRAIGLVLSAMRAHDVQRLITLTGAGVRAPGDSPGFVDKLFRLALSKLQPELLADSEAYVAAVTSSDRQWTVVRAPRLTDGPGQGSYRDAANVGQGTGTALSRPDLARFLLDEVERERYVGRLPVVSS